MKREPTAEEREKIVRAIVAGDRIGATSMYISITECGLTEAQEFIRARGTELQAENPENLAGKQPKHVVSLLATLLRARDAPSDPVRRSMPVFPPSYYKDNGSAEFQSFVRKWQQFAPIGVLQETPTE